MIDVSSIMQQMIHSRRRRVPLGAFACFCFSRNDVSVAMRLLDEQQRVEIGWRDLATRNKKDGQCNTKSRVTFPTEGKRNKGGQWKGIL